MKFSIVTISYNQEKFLEEAILSVLNQNYRNVEYIVVDPGSTDGSREIIEKYRDRIDRVIFEPDEGASDGLNKGFQQATGDIYYFINSDDFMLPNCLSRIEDYFKTNPEVDVLLAGGEEVNSDGYREGDFYPSKVSAKAYVNGAVTLFQQGMFFRSALFRSVGGFNAKNRTCWDGELLLAFILSGAKFSRLMIKVAAFRIYPGSITGSQRFVEQFNADQRRMFQMVYGRGQTIRLVNKIYYRAKKLLADPLYVYKRLMGGK